MKKQWIALLLSVSLIFTGCGALDTVADKVMDAATEQVGNAIVGKAEVVDSISTDRYCYSLLSDEDKIVYDQMLDAMLSYDEEVALSTKDSSILQTIYDYIYSDYGNLFWVSGFTYSTYYSGERVLGIAFTPTYVFTEEEKEAYQAEVDAVVADWLSGISADASDYNKSKYVFDLMFEKVEYNLDSENNQNILSVFLNGESVCQGYSDATWYLLNELGIPCTIVRGTANGEAHAWNLVYLDGEYYYIDTTWGNGRYLSGDNTITKVIDYHYLNTTTEFLSQTHTFGDTYELPLCTATADSYY